MTWYYNRFCIIILFLPLLLKAKIERLNVSIFLQNYGIPQHYAIFYAMGKCHSEGNYSFRSRASPWSEIVIKKLHEFMECNLQGSLNINSVGK